MPAQTLFCLICKPSGVEFLPRLRALLFKHLLRLITVELGNEWLNDNFYYYITTIPFGVCVCVCEMHHCWQLDSHPNGLPSCLQLMAILYGPITDPLHHTRRFAFIDSPLHLFLFCVVWSTVKSMISVAKKNLYIFYYIYTIKWYRNDWLVAIHFFSIQDNRWI